MHRLLALVMVVGCGSAEPTTTAPPEPASPPTKPDQVAIGGTGDDPCDGGEILGADPCAGGEVKGGLGMRGTSPGAGGGNVGGPGLGSVGTIGHGAGQGTSVSYGAGRARGNVLPKVTIGKETIVGALDGAVIRRVVRRYLGQIRYCYEKELTQHPALAGTVVLDFVISPEGTVVQAKGTGVSPEVETCLAGRAMVWVFPKPKQAIVKVSIPFTLAPVP